MDTTAVERTQDTLLRRCAAGQRLHVGQHPAQQGDRTQAIQWPFQTEGERRPTRHTRRPTLPSTTTPTPPPAKAQPRGRPLRPTPTLRPPEYRHRRHHRPQPQSRPINRSSRHQSQGHTRRSRQTQCENRQRANHRPQSTAPHPLDHAIPTGTSRPRRNCAFSSHNRLTQLEIVTHTNPNRDRYAYLNNPTTKGTRFSMNPLDVQCATCRATAGERCISPQSQRPRDHHPARLWLARAALPCPKCAAEPTRACTDQQGQPQADPRRLHLGGPPAPVQRRTSPPTGHHLKHRSTPR